jgi:hypothetical protein
VKYNNGDPVILGDKVDLGGEMKGVVVAVIDTNEFSLDYPADEWSYLAIGALVVSSDGGLIHYTNSEQNFILIERAPS